MPDEAVTTSFPLSLYGGSSNQPIATPTSSVSTSTPTGRLPRNERNNNPGNLVHGGKWQGLSANQTDDTYAQFDTPEAGLDAMRKQLELYQTKHGLKTAREILGRWTPESATPSSTYIGRVKNEIGVDPDEPIDIVNNPELRAKLANFIIKKEGGRNPYSQDQVMGNVSSSPRPTIQNVLAHKTKQTNYSEENIPSNSFLPMTNTQDMLKQRFQDIHTKQPQDRANLGAKLGAGIGMRNGGLAGGLLGAAIGAFAGRALGQITSGEQAKQTQLQTTTQDLHNLGIAKGNFVTFKDGGEFPLDLNMKLTNVDTVTNPNKTRTVYEIDRTNPLTNRTVALVTPLAQIIASKSKQGRATNESIAMLVNMVQAGALNIEQVKQRVREMTFKLGLSKQELGDLYNG
jgi:hypothetical protein